MLDYALVFIYGSFIGLTAVSIGTIIKPFFNSGDK